MADIEHRLKALEKQTRNQREQIQALFGDTKALTIIIDSLGAAICANNKPLLRTVILNLRQFETFSRQQNEHEATIVRLRTMREFFEGRLNKADGVVPPPAADDAPRRQR